jgi:polyisoprenoid-binding protein YceI
MTSIRHLPVLLLASTSVSRTLVAQRPAGAEVYTVDESHSLLDFTTRLIGLNRVRGSFGVWRADFTYDPANPARSSVTFVARIASINTESRERDDHLRSPDFFDAKKYPWLRFESRSVTAAGSGLVIEGDLTIRDSTRRIRFPVEVLFPEQRDPFGNRRLVFGGKATLNRRDFGIAGPRFWGQAIADSVTIEMELAGRIWEYARLGFRPNATYAPTLLAAADSGKLDRALEQARAQIQAERDTTKLPPPFGIEIAAMRLAQRGDWVAARKILEMTLEAAGPRWPPDARSSLETRLAEAWFHSGDSRRALEHAARAVELDPANTNAVEWRKLIEAANRD